MRNVIMNEWGSMSPIDWLGKHAFHKHGLATFEGGEHC